MEQTPLTVGTPEQVIEKTLTFRDYAGDYQRRLFTDLVHERAERQD